MADIPKPSKPKTETHIIETKDGPIKITQPAGGRRHHGISVVLDTDDVVREQVGGFANFIREYAVVGLAVGFIVGQQANAVMKQMVASFVDPWMTVVFGTDFKDKVAIVHSGTEAVPVPWGLFVYTLVEFFVVLLTIYIVIKLFRLDKLKPKDKDKK